MRFVTRRAGLRFMRVLTCPDAESQVRFRGCAQSTDRGALEKKSREESLLFSLLPRLEWDL